MILDYFAHRPEHTIEGSIGFCVKNMLDYSDDCSYEDLLIHRTYRLWAASTEFLVLHEMGTPLDTADVFVYNTEFRRISISQIFSVSELMVSMKRFRLSEKTPRCDEDT
jgi:hypothetical protein